jgi:hypothetical protein
MWLYTSLMGDERARSQAMAPDLSHPLAWVLQHLLSMVGQADQLQLTHNTSLQAAHTARHIDATNPGRNTVQDQEREMYVGDPGRVWPALS